MTDIFCGNIKLNLQNFFKAIHTGYGKNTFFSFHCAARYIILL